MAIQRIVTVPLEMPKRGEYIRRVIEYDDQKPHREGGFQIVGCWWEIKGFDDHHLTTRIEKARGVEQKTTAGRGITRIDADVTDTRIVFGPSRRRRGAMTWRLPEKFRISAATRTRLTPRRG